MWITFVAFIQISSLVFEILCFVPLNAVTGKNGQCHSNFSILRFQNPFIRLLACIGSKWLPNDDKTCTNNTKWCRQGSPLLHSLLCDLHFATLPDFFDVKFTDHKMRYIWLYKEWSNIYHWMFWWTLRTPAVLHGLSSWNFGQGLSQARETDISDIAPIKKKFNITWQDWGSIIKQFSNFS